MFIFNTKIVLGRCFIFSLKKKKEAEKCMLPVNTVPRWPACADNLSVFIEPLAHPCAEETLMYFQKHS